MGNDIINMMKFFALVALALVATSNAQTTVAAVTATRADLVAGAAGGNLVLSVTASNAGNIVKTTGNIIAVVNGNIFSADGDTSCTATAEDASGTAVGTA